MNVQVLVQCSRCGGCGQVAPFGTCFTCNGSGVMTATKDLGKAVLRRSKRGAVRVLSLTSGATVETFAANDRVLDGLRQLHREGNLRACSFEGWTWARIGFETI